MSASSPMKEIGEVDGVRIFWAEPGRFTLPGVYYWDGCANVHIPLSRDGVAREPVLDEHFDILHNGYRWLVVRVGTYWFARKDGGGTGPYISPVEAVDWIKAIRPAPNTSADTAESLEAQNATTAEGG